MLEYFGFFCKMEDLGLHATWPPPPLDQMAAALVQADLSILTSPSYSLLSIPPGWFTPVLPLWPPWAFKDSRALVENFVALHFLHQR